MYDDKKERDIKSDDSADRVRVSIVSSSLARNRIRLSVNTRNKVVNATIATTTKTADGKNEIGGTERQVERHAASPPAVQQIQSFLNGPLIHRGQTVSRL